MQRRKSDIPLSEALLPVDAKTLSVLWADVKELHARIKTCKSYAEQQLNQTNDASWAAVVEILEGRM